MNAKQIKHNLKIAEWTRLIQERQASGLTVESWCEKTGTSRDQYYYWLRRVRNAACTAIEERVSASMDPPEMPSFAKVNINSIPPRESGINIQFREVNIRISPESNTEHVHIVLEAMLHA